MTIGDRERLLGRIRQIRRSVAARESQSNDASDPRAADPQDDRLKDLEGRVAHLEHLLEGLQDSVHREFARHDELIAQIQNQIEPATLRAALAENARNRGL
jgi:uncharacterized coiled-coil protein SlyX